MSPDAAGPDTLEPHLQARILTEALPFMQRYDKQTVVVKIGGHAMGDVALSESFAKDIVLLKQSGVNPVVVHGGGPQIGALLDRLGIDSAFEGGLRVTDEATVQVVEMVLAGSINKRIVADLNRQGGRAVGISGKDGKLMVARKLERRVRDAGTNVERIVDLGFVGEPECVNPRILEAMVEAEFIPVVAPISVDRYGESLNVNADTFAGALAAKMKATRLLMLTDVDGVLDESGALVEELTIEQARGLIADGTINNGMIPKIETCISVVEGGVEGVVVINGRVPHAVLLELLTAHGAGTLLKES